MRAFTSTLAVGIACMFVAFGQAAAQAETQTLVSGPSDGLCIDPTPGFQPASGGSENYAPLYTPHSGPFPDSGAACGVQSPSSAVVVPQSAAVISEFWKGTIPGASWVSLDEAGLDFSNPPPAYYIFTSTFALCPSQPGGAQLSLHMFADDLAGAFLNGVPIGHFSDIEKSTYESFESPPGPAGGWGFTSATGLAGGFVAGANYLQVVVRDNAEDHVGADFAALVSVPACELAAFGPSGVVQAPSNAVCVSKRSFLIHVRSLAGLVYRKVRVEVNGHLVRAVRGRDITAPIDLRGLPRGTYVVKITVLTTKDVQISGTRTYHTCRAHPTHPRGQPKL